MLNDPIVPMLLRMAWPNVLIMVAQASTGLIETWWVSHLGTDALAGMALVFPVLMLTQMISAGAMGGGISSAIARALGGDRRDEADALVLHAITINVVLGLSVSGLMLLYGRSLYGLLGGEGAALEAAVIYSAVVFGGNALLWVMNGLASVIRGTGNMLVPALVICGGVVLLVPLSPVLIFGLGPIPAMGIAGGGAALVLYYAAGTAVLGWYILAGRNLARFRWVRLRWSLFRDILRIGAVGSVTSLQTNVTIAVVTGLVASAAGTDAIAGFGTAVRLEYLLVPLVFGLGAPLVALVGTNIGAGNQERALRIAVIGGGLAFALTETIGLAAAIWPQAWLALFSAEPAMIEAGSAYLRIVGPSYGFFGLGLALYFASQGAGRLLWPLCSGFLRLLVAMGGGWLALHLTGSIDWLFAAVALGLVVYGATMAVAIRGGAWFPGSAK
ncbi:MATE efflux family protein [alpha proteobacterium BAL199]|nr:MATE efflux family protein [alpha proteobacterium BAL199]